MVTWKIIKHYKKCQRLIFISHVTTLLLRVKIQSNRVAYISNTATSRLLFYAAARSVQKETLIR